MRLLAKSTSRRLRAYRLDRVSDTLDEICHTIADDGEAGWQSAVVYDGRISVKHFLLYNGSLTVNQEHVLETLSGIASNELRHNLAANRRPDMVYTVLITNSFRIVQRCRAVSVGDDEDVASWEDLDRTCQRWSNDVFGLVYDEAISSKSHWHPCGTRTTWDQQGGVVGSGSTVRLSEFLVRWHPWFVLELVKKGNISVSKQLISFPTSTALFFRSRQFDRPSLAMLVVLGLPSTYMSATPIVTAQVPRTANLCLTTQYNHQTVPFHRGRPTSTK